MSRDAVWSTLAVMSVGMAGLQLLVATTRQRVWRMPMPGYHRTVYIPVPSRFRRCDTAVFLLTCCQALVLGVSASDVVRFVTVFVVGVCMMGMRLWEASVRRQTLATIRAAAVRRMMSDDAS
jgi:hypothetical protein